MACGTKKVKMQQKKARWRGCKMKENVLAPIHVLFWDLVTYWDSVRLFCILTNLFLLNLVQIFFYHQFVITNYIWLNILEDSKLIHYFVVNINCNKNLSTYNTMVLEHCQEILVKWIETSDFLVNAYWWALFIGRWEG